MASDSHPSASAATPFSSVESSAASFYARDREMVQFAKVWAPYGGGPDEDIFVTFGLTPREYFTRLTTLLPLLPAGELTPSQLRTIRTLCAERLGTAETMIGTDTTPDAGPRGERLTREGT